MLKYKSIILSILFVLAVFLICFRFTSTPKVWVDEGVFTETAKNLAWHGTLGLQTAPGQFFSMRNFLLSTSYPVIAPVAVSFNLFGTGLWQARLPMLIYMFGLVVAFYLFTKTRYGFNAALPSVLLLLSFSPFYGNGRPVQGEVPGLFFLVLGAWLLLLWEESGFSKKKLAILSGLSLGLAAATKPIFLVGISLALIISIIFWLKKIKSRKIILYLAIGFILPVLLWCFIHFPTAKDLSLFVSNFLYFSGTHESNIPLFWTVFVNLSKFITESTPILFTLLSLAVISPIAYKLYKKESLKISISEFLILCFIILNWTGFLMGTGWYRYIFPAHTLLYLLFPAAILCLAGIAKSKFLGKLLLTIPIILIIFQFTHLAFFSDTSFTANRTRNTELATALSKVDTSEKVFFYGSIEAVVFYQGDNYHQYLDMGFLKAGDENALAHSSYDVILTDASLKDSALLSTCYDSRQIDRYFLFQNKKQCER